MPLAAYCCIFGPNKPQLMCILVLLDYPIIVGAKVHVLCSLFVHMFVIEHLIFHKEKDYSAYEW